MDEDGSRSVWHSIREAFAQQWTSQPDDDDKIAHNSIASHATINPKPFSKLRSRTV